ncbi:MAG: retropepsin-like aspartic protease [Candidatus Thermoplasmatota archaeon]|nr:retropepsin-like aspartic protease [Candidatus Thermoplasmatota archaeon]
MLPCRFEWKGKKTPIIDGWLDSGADSIVLPLAIAKYLGLELQDASPMRVVGGSVERFESIVDLTIGRAGRFTSFPNVKVSIPKKEDDTPVLLGRDPIFDNYNISFFGKEKKFTMRPCE